MKSPINANPLWQATRDMHHACECHPVGAAMATGAPPAIWYAAWLQALRQIHEAVDPTLDASLHRVDKLDADIAACETSVPASAAAHRYVQTLTTEHALAGAAYVLTGAHLMGGEIMRKRLQGFPTGHLTWDDRAQALVLLGALRAKDGIAQEARACFAALLEIMDEIQTTWPQEVLA